MSRIIDLLKGELERIKDTFEHAIRAITDELYDDASLAFQECADELKKTHDQSWWNYWSEKTAFQDSCEKEETMREIIGSLNFRLDLLQVQIDNTPTNEPQTLNSLKAKQTEVKNAVNKAEDFAKILKALCDLAKAYESLCRHIKALGN